MIHLNLRVDHRVVGYRSAGRRAAPHVVTATPDSHRARSTNTPTASGRGRSVGAP